MAVQCATVRGVPVTRQYSELYSEKGCHYSVERNKGKYRQISKIFAFVILFDFTYEAVEKSKPQIKHWKLISVQIILYFAIL